MSASWINGIRRTLSRKTVAETFFSEQGLLCEQCHTVLPLDGLAPFTFVHCPRCNANLFVPLPIGPFLLFEPLGAGGVASVYKAWHRDRPDELFAVKILKQEHRANKEFIRLFLAEGEIHRQITDHPHIVKYVAGGREDDEYYYAMEFIRGVRLKRWIGDKGRLPEKTGWQLGLELLSALSHIYACGFLYRDLNAGNVMLKSDGHCVLFDFGLTLKIEEAVRVTPEDHIWGSGEFLPPERVYRKGETASSPIYSLGLLMYFLLSGENFMKSDSARGLAARQVSAVRLTLNPSLLRGCSENTLNVINMMIEPNPKDRFQTFEEVESTVKELLAVL